MSLTPHFYIVKPRFTLVYIFFLFLLPKYRSWGVLVRTAWCGCDENTLSIFWSKIKKKISLCFIWKLPNFTTVKIRSILHGLVCVMKRFLCVIASCSPLNHIIEAILIDGHNIWFYWVISTFIFPIPTPDFPVFTRICKVQILGSICTEFYPWCDTACKIITRSKK